MGHIAGERHDDFDRLHYPDGAHRGTARSANGRELDWFEKHHRLHLDKHRELTEEKEPVRYVWTIQDAEGPVPSVGTLTDYAKVCDAAEISGAFLVSSSLWTWDEEGRPVEHKVETERGRITETYRVPIEYRVNGETVIHFADGSA